MIRYAYDMNLRDLEYLVAVDKHQHFGKAADSCYVSQPALSMQISKLEDVLGVKLFERTNKKVMTTKIGKDIIARAKNILKEADDIVKLAKSSQNPKAGEIYIGAFPTLSPYYFPKIIPLISEKLPDLKVFLVEDKTDNLLAMLGSGELDMAFLVMPAGDDSLESQYLFDDEFLLCTPKNHPLAKRKFISQKDINMNELLLLEEGHCLREQALSFCSLTNAAEHQDFRATSLETLRQMVATGAGVTLIPKLAKREGDNVAYIPFSKPAPSRKIGAFWRHNCARKSTVSEMVKLLSKQHYIKPSFSAKP